MVNPNEEIARAIVNLSGDISFERLVTWIDESLRDQAISNCNNMGENTIKTQGRCMELMDLLKHINEAPQYLKNIKENNKVFNGGIL